MNIEFISKLVENFRDSIETRGRRCGRDFRKAKNAQDCILSDEEKLDIMNDDSFPASDPPGQILKSEEDLKQY